jgi:hypothetical protein
LDSWKRRSGSKRSRATVSIDGGMPSPATRSSSPTTWGEFAPAVPVELAWSTLPGDASNDTGHERTDRTRANDLGESIHRVTNRETRVTSTGHECEFEERRRREAADGAEQPGARYRRRLEGVPLERRAALDTKRAGTGTNAGSSLLRPANALLSAQLLLWGIRA